MSLSDGRREREKQVMLRQSVTQIMLVSLQLLCLLIRFESVIDRMNVAAWYRTAITLQRPVLVI